MNPVLNKSSKISQKNTRVAYVGGLWGHWNKFVKRMYNAYGNVGDVYFEHHQRKALATWIDENNSEFSVIVIGHSYGGNSAARVVSKGHFVDKLITVDPVGRFKADFKRAAVYSNIWVNYVAIGGGMNRNNTIARLGGWYGHKPKKYADEHTLIDLDHVAICFQCCRP